VAADIIRPEPLKVLWCGTAWNMKVGMRYEAPLNIFFALHNTKNLSRFWRDLSEKKKLKLY
jgi:hypothetical protein